MFSTQKAVDSNKMTDNSPTSFLDRQFASVNSKVKFFEAEDQKTES